LHSTEIQESNLAKRRVWHRRVTGRRCGQDAGGPLKVFDPGMKKIELQSNQ